MTHVDISDAVHDEPLLARYLIERVIGRAAGRDETECTHLAPRDKYFVGSLRPSPPAQLGVTPLLDELLSKLAPVAFGAEFKVHTAPAAIEVSVTLSWNCYYRVFPSLAEQRVFQRYAASDTSPQDRQASPAVTGASSNAANPSIAAVNGNAVVTPPPTSAAGRSTDFLFPKWRRIQCKATAPIRLPAIEGTEVTTIDVGELQLACNREIARVRQLITADPDRLRTGPDPEQRVRIPDHALTSESDLTGFRRTLARELSMAWSWAVAAQLRRTQGANAAVLFVEATNTSSIDTRAWHSEGFFFDVKAEFSFPEGAVEPFQVDHVPSSFRYDRRVWSRGFNCSVVGPQMDRRRLSFETTSAPVFTQARYSTNTEPAARFADLARDPIPVLRMILAAMNGYDSAWTQQRRTFSDADPGWEATHGEEFDRDHARFLDECARFSRGCEFVEANPDVRLAFQLTNRAFASLGEKTAWRLFQVVFIVSQIPDVVALTGEDSQALEEREKVDIIYFPTGGGKTEAYLGAITFHCFFDRLRGKTAGVTAWTRFPLRLLTLQQMQRVADVVGAAELIRKAEADSRLSGPGADRFAVGYFVGEEATPNELVSPANGAPPEANWSKATDAVARQRWKMVVKCPACRTNSVTIDFDVDAVRVLHRCTNQSCRFESGILPIYVVDNEIYRNLPAVIVGTIDKLAGLGNQRKISLILGDVTGRCTKHGYYNAKCCQKDCVDPARLKSGQPRGISGPTLFIQDELHLLKEGFGTFDGHYETCLHELLRAGGNRFSAKIIASSATIEAFERQVQHLYGRQARVFPGAGPTLRESFYAQTLDRPQRFFVGILPHNKTILNATLELLQAYHEEVENVARTSAGSANPFGGRTVPGSQRWTELLDPYVTSLVYFSATRELNSIRTDLDTHVNTELQRGGYSGLRIAELSGSTSTDAVTRVLERLEGAAPGSDTAPNVVLATSMISHGVDVDRFNCMAFYGMPKANAEYIQASSRVGRSHVGIVFTCFKPARERDQSHFAYFDKYHEYLGRLVEPVAINRWSKFGVERTLPGLFMAVLLQHVANRSGQAKPNLYYMVDFVKRQISDGTLRVDQFADLLERGYKVDLAPHGAGDAFRQEIRRRVRMFFDQILGAGGNAKFVSEALVPTPMRSLRDVDEQIVIELDSNGGAWASVSAQ